MIILLDLDGVIINFVKGVCNWFDIPHEPEKVTHWDSLLGLTDENVQHFWGSLKTPNFWETLEFYDGSKEFIKELKKFGKVVLCTSPAHGCAGFRQNWIEKYLPEFFTSGDYILTPNKEYCANSKTILIDDSDTNCGKFTNAGGTVLLYPQPWNLNNNLIENKNDFIFTGLGMIKEGLI